MTKICKLTLSVLLLGSLTKAHGQCSSGNYSTTNVCCQELLNQQPAAISGYSDAEKEEWWAARLACATKIYQNPSLYPNYLMVVAHRGYFRDVPENSLAAFQLAIELGVPVVEIDIWETKDGVLICGHDYLMGKTSRSVVPDRMKTHSEYLTYGSIKVSSLTLCEIRPDLCNSDDYVGLGEYKKASPKLANQSEPAHQSNPDLVSTDCDCDPRDSNNPCTDLCEPFKGGAAEQAVSAPITTLQEVFNLCKGKVLVNLDKIDERCPRDEGAVCTRDLAPYHRVYQEAIKAGLIVSDNVLTDEDESFTQIIVKGKPVKIPSAAAYKAMYPDVNWNLVMYTPTFFSEYTISNDILSAWVNEPDFNCTGFEIQATTQYSLLYPYIPYIKNNLKKSYVAFASYPEFCHHFFKDPRVDFDINWNWYFRDTEHLPNVIITDRLEVLVELIDGLHLNSTAR